MSHRDAKRRPSIHRLAKSQDFDILQCSLEDGGNTQEWLTPSGTTALHILLKYRPPLALVNLLCDRLASSPKSPILVPEECLDKKRKQTPLHVAVKHGCHVSIIERLLKGESLAIPACTKDIFDRLPLHWACANPTGTNKFLSKKDQPSLDHRIDNMAKIILTLLIAYPEGVHVADKTECTPLQLAIQNKADPCILRILHAFTTNHKSRKDLSGSKTATSQTAAESCDLDEIVLMTADTMDDDLSSVGFDGASVYNPRNTTKRSPSIRRISKKNGELFFL
jgi:ankyrin repeat protein